MQSSSITGITSHSLFSLTVTEFT